MKMGRERRASNPKVARIASRGVAASNVGFVGALNGENGQKE
jgi:hypothetical protein